MKSQLTKSGVSYGKGDLTWIDQVIVMSILIILVALLVPAVVLNSPLRAMHQAFLPRLIGKNASGHPFPAL